MAAIQAAGQLGTAVEDALNNMQSDRSRLPHKYDGAFDTITRAIRVARAKLDQVEAAESDRQAVRLSPEIWAMLQEVVRLYFQAGQQIAMPALIDAEVRRGNPGGRARPAASATGAGAAGGPRPAADPGSRSVSGSAAEWARGGLGAGRRRIRAAHRGPSGQPAAAGPPPAPPTLGERLGLRFDAWELTDTGARSTYRNDPTRIAELEAFWRADTNPDETHRLFGLIMAAVKAGQVAVRPGEFSKTCPWISTVRSARRRHDRHRAIQVGQLFTIRAGPEGAYFGRGFERLGFVPGSQPVKPRPARRGHSAAAGHRAPAGSHGTGQPQRPAIRPSRPRRICGA